MPARNSNLFCVSCTVDPKRQQRLELRNGEEKVQGKTTYKKKIKLDTCFTCPFCNHAGTVECNMDKKHMTGIAFCYICKESYSTTIHGLSEPIDVYCEWIDECEWVNKFED